MSIITLTTDFGLKDHFVGALKGKILSEYREATIVDISHHIDLFNIPEASYVINAAYSGFPKGTVHLVGVDAERNKETKHIAMQWNDHFFICADNGILSILTQKIVPQKIVEITIHDRFDSNVTDMDVFVKVACHIARGGLLNVIGREISEIKTVNLLQPVISNDKTTIKGNIIYIDHFGNCVTNISKQIFKDVGRGRSYEVKLGNSKTKINAIKNKYAEVATNKRFTLKDYEGLKLALFNEVGLLEICIYRSNPLTVGTAKSLFGLKYQDVVSIEFKE